VVKLRLAAYAGLLDLDPDNSVSITRDNILTFGLSLGNALRGGLHQDVLGGSERVLRAFNAANGRSSGALSSVATLNTTPGFRG